MWINLSFKYLVEQIRRALRFKKNYDDASFGIVVYLYFDKKKISTKLKKIIGIKKW